MRAVNLIILVLTLFLNLLSAQDSTSILQITSEPKGANIYFDNVLSGNTPNILNRVSTGEHNIKIVREGYEDWITDFTVEMIDTNKIHVILNPLRGQIQVNCDVKKAYIYIDNKLVGQTPKLITDLEYGEHYIEVRRRRYNLPNSNYTAYRDTIIIKDSDLITIETLLETSWITIISEPVGTEVSIDGEKIGKTPILKIEVKWGNHTFQFKKNGFLDKQLDTFINPLEHKSLNVELDYKSSKTILTLSSFFPGLGQIYAIKYK